MFLVTSELLAIGCSSIGLSFLSDQSISHSSVMAVTGSVVAVLWNWLFNYWFEISYAKAFIMDIAMTVFFLFGTFVFTWIFDSLFGQPKLVQKS